MTKSKLEKRISPIPTPFSTVDRNTYKTKLDDILNDDSKITRITDDPIKNLKKHLNSIAKANNAVSNYMKLPVVVRDYKPGYICIWKL